MGDSSSSRPAPHILPTIVVAQFAGSSVWFVGNAVLPDLAHHWSGITGGLAWVTSSVQLGFIAGTLLFAFSGLSDRIRSHHLFAASATLAGAANAASMIAPESFGWFMAMRVLTGISLAGVYPVGMKLAASWFRDGLGSAIGFLVGALVLGTAFPQLLRSLALDPGALVFTASGLALTGGVAVVATVPEGPGVGRGRPGRVRDAFDLFAIRDFRSAALGYFGHMWELYAFWAFVPFAVQMVAGEEAGDGRWAFAIIGAGSIGCVAGGFASRRWGSARVAGALLSGSGTCCLLSPFVLSRGSAEAGLAFLVLWGVMAAGDSPQFSAVAARSAPPDKVGTGLTVMNALGFALTIPAISLLSWVAPHIPEPWLFTLLLPGPMIGVWGLRHVLRADPTRP
ncbi:MAG: MFS transporter [Nannocystales bacterium]